MHCHRNRLAINSVRRSRATFLILRECLPATALGIDHSTAFRRLNALEERLGVRLFDRLPGGIYEATSAGERTAATAERMEDEALALDRDLTGRDHRPLGRLRVTSSETLAHRVLTRAPRQLPKGAASHCRRAHHRQPRPQPLAARGRHRAQAGAPERGRSVGPQARRRCMDPLWVASPHRGEWRDDLRPG